MASRLPEAPRRPLRPPAPYEIEQAGILREGRISRARQAMERRQRAAEELARLEVGDEPRR